MNPLLTAVLAAAALFILFYLASAQSPCSAWANEPHLCNSDYFGSHS